MKELEWEVEISGYSYGQLLLLVKLYRFLFKPKGYKETARHSLRFGKKSISYHSDGAILWHINYSRLSYLEMPKSFSPGSMYDNSYSVFIHTNDQDKYCFASTLSQSTIERLKAEIEQISKTYNRVAEGL